jgi:anti-sigma factor RsiW
MTLTCDDLDLLLPEFLDGNLTAEQEEQAAAHLATCEECTLEVNQLEGVTKLYREHGMLKLPDEARKRISAALQIEE